jgi:hypothetical protein
MASMARYGEVISNWHLLIDNFQTSALDFFTSVEQRVKDRAVPDIAVERLDWKEHGMFSANRTFLRIRRGRYTFDICAAPYGKSYFFSWWLTDNVPLFVFYIGCALLVSVPIVLGYCLFNMGFGNGLLVATLLIGLAAFSIESALKERGLSLRDALSVMPFFGTFYSRYMRPVTYYSMDTATMFRESVHRAVMAEVNALRSAQGLRELAPDETVYRSGSAKPSPQNVGAAPAAPTTAPVHA